MRWHPLGESLALCSGSCQLYVWAPAGISVLALPDELRFRVHALSWLPDGQSLVLQDKDRFCCCYLPAQQPGLLGRGEHGAPLNTRAAVAAHPGRSHPSLQEQQDPNTSATHRRPLPAGSAVETHVLSLGSRHPLET
jgi:hypothetical protein